MGSHIVTLCYLGGVQDLPRYWASFLGVQDRAKSGRRVCCAAGLLHTCPSCTPAPVLQGPTLARLEGVRLGHGDCTADGVSAGRRSESQPSLPRQRARPIRSTSSGSRRPGNATTYSRRVSRARKTHLWLKLLRFGESRRHSQPVHADQERHQHLELGAAALEPGPGGGGQEAVTPGRGLCSPAAVNRVHTVLCGVLTAESTAGVDVDKGVWHQMFLVCVDGIR